MSLGPALRVRLCAVDDVVGLRQLVLRPHQTLEEVRWETDGQANAEHFCAYDEAGAVVCVASLWREPPPWQPSAPNAWRLRGMATAPEWREKGAGSAVLTAVVAHVAGGGGGLLWCNARLGAVKFYERAGMATRGEQWEEPIIGPHVAMYMMVPALSLR
ncbi:MAG TPA: GNAT family N-acetyltransferase [Acidimicrobiales bacterium]|nr:GNAT family N-acetyltransferase [Acidimicrobiales bacterium]